MSTIKSDQNLKQNMDTTDTPITEYKIKLEIQYAAKMIDRPSVVYWTLRYCHRRHLEWPLIDPPPSSQHRSPGHLAELIEYPPLKLMKKKD
jgi:hypothetical protein